MSILLEALRKSEKNQRVREAPTIHSDDPSGPVSERLPTGPLAVLLIIALFVSGWLVWRQYQAPEGSYQPPVSLDADRIRAVSKPVAVDRQVEPVVSSSPATRAASGQSRTPVESYQPPDGSESQTTTGAQGPATNDAQNTVANVPINAPSRPEQKTVAGLAEPALEPAANKATGGAEQERYHPGEPAPIGYWELPDAIRAEVPEFKFSVLVFAADPADRFVLIGGQRLEEGDSVQPGLEVKEIRRDGVVFSYRLYQFLVER
jgi:general secretion pathway protein B